MRGFRLIWIILCFAALLAISAAAKTVYVADGGSGSGQSAASPLGSLTAAYAAAGAEGEIVLCGDVTLPKNQMGTTRNAFVEPPHAGKITVRGATGKEKLIFASPYEYMMSGETEIRNLVITSGDYTGGVSFCARGYPLTMGEGITMQSDKRIALGSGEEIGTKVYLLGGCMSGAVPANYGTHDNSLTVRSGSYWGIVGFNRSLNVTTTHKVNLTVGGSVRTGYLIAGSSGAGAFEEGAGALVCIDGDLTVSKQISLGNQNYDVGAFASVLLLKGGNLDFVGDFTDYRARTRLSSLSIYVNGGAPAAMESYIAYFSGAGDREGALADYCVELLGGHESENGICAVCGEKITPVCAAHDFVHTTEGTVLKKVCKTCGYTVGETAKQTALHGVFEKIVGTLRVQILDAGIVRIEERAGGGFVDQNTLLVPDRTVFAGTDVVCDEDGDTWIFSTARFTVNLPKVSPTLAQVKVFNKEGTEIFSFFDAEKHGLYASLPSPAQTPDVFVLTDSEILPPEKGLTYSGSTDETSGWRRGGNTDVYLLLPLGDAGDLRRAFVTLTGRSMLSDIKTLGSWYSKWTNYTAEEKLQMISNYRTEGIPLDMIVIDTEWKNTSVGGNGGSGTGYDVNTELYPNMEKFLADANKAGVLVLFNDHTHQTTMTIVTPEELKWQSAGIKFLLEKGLNGWWYDRNWTYSIKSPFAEVLFSTLGQVLYYDTIADYRLTSKTGQYSDRVLMLSNVDWQKHGHITGEPSVIGHRYGVQWTGDIYGDPLQLRREIENMVYGGVAGASPYTSSDLGGFFHNDTVTRNNFIRWMQYGALSPTVRVHSTLSAKNEQFPWSYDAAAQKIIGDFLKMRYHLMPYLYTLARENYDTGLPLMRRLDFDYPQYPEAQDNSQYLIGRDLLAAPFWSTEGDGNICVPPSWLSTADGRQGLTAKYYNVEKGISKDEFFTGTPIYTERVEKIDNYWYTGSPNAKVNADYFTARYEGRITPAYDCYIGTLADDGARVYIDGELWSDGYASSQVRPYINNDKVLRAGKTYDLAVEYYELSGKAILYLVCEPVLGKDLSQRQVFIPDGTWMNLFTGEEFTGPKKVTVTGGIAETPLFVRKGAILPTTRVQSPMESALYDEISYNVYGLAESSALLYEDDGRTEGYLDGKCRTTTLTETRIGDNLWQFELSGAESAWDGGLAHRTVRLRIHSDTPVLSATVGDTPAAVVGIAADAAALPFAERGAGKTTDVYEITANVDIAKGERILLVAADAADVNGDGRVTLLDALLLLSDLLDGKRQDKNIADVVRIIKKVVE
ncbi:MAG: DUF5110 domain-containing protein [Clostridia bacterium]|nr:DUF5110 domain-containing protein [Clostridia bacterium]